MTDYEVLIGEIREHLEIAMQKLDELEAVLETPPPVATEDILAWASEEVPFAEQSNYTVQCINTYTSAPSVPESGIHGTKLSTGETLRFGKVTDPADPARLALQCQVHRDDPTTSGGKRTELSFTRNIEMDKVYWLAVGVYIYDWGTLSTSDDALFGAQMHYGDNSAGVGGPSFGIYTAQSGRHFQVMARYNTAQDPSGSKPTTVRLAEFPLTFNRWMEFVINFKHNTSGRGFLKAWKDERVVADYSGNLGYNGTPKDYAKFGYYNWTASSMNATPRKVLLRKPTIVFDPTGETYTLEQIRALL